MEINVGDVLELKKIHPCGNNKWRVLRVGMDFKLACCGCAHEIMIERHKIERRIKRIIRLNEGDANAVTK